MRPYLIQRALYNGFVLPAAYGALSAAARFHPKLSETFEGRNGIRERWLEGSRRISGKPVWFHVSSVGEYEQAKPVINSLQRGFPEVPVVITFTSPSGYRYASQKEGMDSSGNVRFVDYLPIDFAGNARFCLDVLDPRLLVFVKFDLWPNLIWEANARGVPAVLIDATLSERSYRYSEIGKRFYRAVYDALRDIMAISESDARRFSASVPDHGGIAITGDTRFDRVMERKTAAGNGIDVDKGNRSVIVAGSTWPRDEVHLLDALGPILRSTGNLLLILAPHEPRPERVAELTDWARATGADVAPFSERGSLTSRDGNRVLVVDTVGILAELYHHADIVYVGGGFSTGVHSVIEPAIMGVPVLFGPTHGNSFEALQLLERDAALAVQDGGDISIHLASLIRDTERRSAMGMRARQYVESQLGATERCMKTLVNYV